MGSLMTRIDDTREHLFRESNALIVRTRDAGNGLTSAVRSEVRGWQDYLKARRFALTRELRELASPAGVKLATLRAADELLARAHETVHTAAEAAAADVRRARRAVPARKAAAATSRPARARKPAKATRARKKGVAFPPAVAA